MWKRLLLICVILCGGMQHPTVARAGDDGHKEILGIPGIESYRQMYLIGTFNDKNNFASVYGRSLGSQYREAEVKFQLSFQALIYDGKDFQVGGSYTQQSYLQAFNKPLSSPVRETDYEPEVFIRWQDKKHPWFGENTFYRFGFDHQSNGQSRPLSRSWNRLYGEVKLQDPDDRWVAAVRAWWRIPEKAANNDNPNITQYYGYWQFDGRWTPFKDNKVHLMLRDNLRVKNRSAVQIDWSWKPPVFDDFSLYAQAFFGYGENLIDYQNYNTRFGAGIILTNW